MGGGGYGGLSKARLAAMSATSPGSVDEPEGGGGAIFCWEDI